jgi:hypothetical protein
MTAEALAKALGGRKAGVAWMARCPAHADRKPSLAITDAKDGAVLVRCHAGSDQHDVIEALRARDRAAVVAAAILQIAARVPDHERLQTLEQYLRDEFSDVERQAAADWCCRDA